MAVDVTQLAAALRLGDGVTAPVEPLLSILTRSLGVADATVALLAPDAPDAVKDQAAVNYAAYLYDTPSAPSGNRYAAAWLNSGAAALVASWVVRRIVQDVDSEAGSDTPIGSGGISESRVNQLVNAAITAHTAIVAAHHTPGTGGGGGGLTTAQVNDLIADWAETGNSAMIPAAKYRAPTSTERGAPFAMTNTVVDNDAHTGGTLYAWARSHVKRLVERIVPAWARDVGTPIPADKLINAPSGGGETPTIGAASLVQREINDVAFHTGDETTIAGLTIPAHMFSARETWLFMVSLNVGATAPAATGQWHAIAELHEGTTRLSDSVSFSIDLGIGNNHSPSPTHTVGVTSEGEALGFNYLHTFGVGEPEDISVSVNFSNDATGRRVGAGSTLTALRLAAGDFADIEDIKPFARTDNATKPDPVDIAPNPTAGRVLGLRTAGGRLETSWNQLSAGSPHLVLDTVPTPPQRQIGQQASLVPQGGVVLVRETANHPTQLWVRVSPDFTLVLFHVFGDPIVRADATTGQLPVPMDYPGRVGIAGNQILISVNMGGHDKVVTFLDYGPTRPEPPTRSAQELLYGGSVADPPHSTIGNYVVNTILWDRGSSVWVIKPTADATRWSTYSGPIGYHTGRLYQTNADAAVHVANATEIGDVYIIGHGSSQRPRIVTAFVAPAADNWQWVPLGLSIQDVAAQVEAHNASGAAHADIRSAFMMADANLMTSLAAVMTGYEAGDATLQAAIDALTAASGLTILAYSDSATYSRGSSNSIVVHADGLFIYISNTERSANHDPGLFPGYWMKLSEGVAYEVITSGSHRIAARTIIVNGDNDNVYLCTTTQTTPRDLAYIHAQSQATGGAFIQLNRPADLTGLPVVRDFDNSTLNILRQAGDIDLFMGGVYMSLIAHTPGLGAANEPGQNDDFARIDNQAAGRALVQHQFNSHADLYTASSTSPAFTFPYPAGTTRASWQASYVTGYLAIDSRISSYPSALGGARGWPLTGLHASLLWSQATEDFTVAVSFLNDGIRLQLQGFGAVPSGDRARFNLDLTALA